MNTIAMKPQSLGLRSVLAWFGSVFAVLDAAISVSAAAESHRKPKTRDLRTLGIDPAAYANIR